MPGRIQHKFMDARVPHNSHINAWVHIYQRVHMYPQVHVTSHGTIHTAMGTYMRTAGLVSVFQVSSPNEFNGFDIRVD